MKLNRRNALKAGAALAATGGARLSATGQAEVVVYDSRTAGGRSFARTAHNSIDIAQQDAKGWREFRSPLPSGSIVGLTCWSDYVIARGYAEEQGKRLKSEVRQSMLIRWEMV